MDTKINSTLEQAELHLDDAREGLLKPEEDVVPYAIYKNAHSATVKFLSAFILSNGKDLPTTITVENLLARSREVHPGFKKLHLSPFYHPTDTEDVWMNLDTANSFLALAEDTKALVFQLLPKQPV